MYETNGNPSTLQTPGVENPSSTPHQVLISTIKPTRKKPPPYVSEKTVSHVCNPDGSDVGYLDFSFFICIYSGIGSQISFASHTYIPSIEYNISHDFLIPFIVLLSPRDVFPFAPIIILPGGTDI